MGIPATVLSVYERGRRQPGVDIFCTGVRAAGFEIEYSPVVERADLAVLDPIVQGERLAAVLTLAEALPSPIASSISSERIHASIDGTV